MVGRIEDVKARLADYDTKMASFEEEYGYWSSRMMARSFVDDLRALLAVAEAAVKLNTQMSDFKWFQSATKEEIMSAFDELHESLEALDKPASEDA